VLFCHLRCHSPSTCHTDDTQQLLQRTHLDLQQYQQKMLILQQQQQQQQHDLHYNRSQESASSQLHRRQQQQQQESSFSENPGKQNETLQSLRSLPSFRDYSKNTASRGDTSSDSDSSQSHTSFVRADVQTTRRTDKECSSSASASLHSASASSQPSSVASSLEFQGRWTSSEIESPTYPLVLESGIHLR
jgi:hypothetical protein